MYCERPQGILDGIARYSSVKVSKQEVFNTTRKVKVVGTSGSSCQTR
jgi:hypothetical protein